MLAANIKNKIQTNHILQILCRAVKICGIGDFWHKNSNETKSYKLYQTVLMLTIYIYMIFELLEVVLKSYPININNDVMGMFTVHVVIMLRFHAIVFKKSNIRGLHQYIVEDCKGYEEETVLNKQYRKTAMWWSTQTILVCLTLLSFIIEALWRRFYQNMPIIFMVTYWPSLEDVSYVAIGFRYLILFINFLIAVFTVAIDSLVATHLIVLSFKFENLRKYFENMNDDFASQDVTNVVLKLRCLDGLLHHKKLIRLSRKIDECFGFMISLHICEVTIGAVGIMFGTAKSGRISMNLIKSFGLLVILFFQLAMYMWNAGEVTYQASLMSEAVFYCGWHLRGVKDHGSRDLRRIVLMGCAQAQRPVVIKAFGIQDLSYESFVFVLRATYSMFAVVY